MLPVIRNGKFYLTITVKVVKYVYISRYQLTVLLLWNVTYPSLTLLLWVSRLKANY